MDKIDFIEAFAAALEGKGIDVWPGENWSKHKVCYGSKTPRGVAMLIDQEGVAWWPTKEQIKNKWHVEPEGNPQIDQPAGIPWKKFAAKELPEKEFDFLAILKNGSIKSDTWMSFDSGYDSYNVASSRIYFYCPLSEIPRPE